MRTLIATGLPRLLCSQVLVTVESLDSVNVREYYCDAYRHGNLALQLPLSPCTR